MRAEYRCGPHWPAEPRLVEQADAELILRDERRYSLESEADGMERVYFTNVDNLRG